MPPGFTMTFAAAMVLEIGNFLASLIVAVPLLVSLSGLSFDM